MGLAVTFLQDVVATLWYSLSLSFVLTRLDLAIVLIGWMLPLGRAFILQMSPNAYTILALLRAARLFRVFRTLKSFKSVEAIQTIIQTLFLSLPALTTIWLLTLLIGCKAEIVIYFVDFYTVLSVFLFGTIDPENFGSLQKSAKVYLQVSSLDLWTTIYFKSKYAAPSLFPVLVSYVIVLSFVLLNLLTAVIVDNLAMLRKKLSKTRSKKVSINVLLLINIIIGINVLLFISYAVDEQKGNSLSNHRGMFLSWRPSNLASSFRNGTGKRWRRVSWNLGWPSTTLEISPSGEEDDRNISIPNISKKDANMHDDILSESGGFRV